VKTSPTALLLIRVLYGERAKRVITAVMSAVLLVPLFSQTQKSWASTVESHVVIYVDLDPTHSATGTSLLVKEALIARREAGCMESILLKEEGRPNHLMLVEVWHSVEDLNAFRSGAQYKRFRSDLLPTLASPFDERIGQRIAP
jgi:quinol monooxygenase YgiN